MKTSAHELIKQSDVLTSLYGPVVGETYRLSQLRHIVGTRSWEDVAGELRCFSKDLSWATAWKNLGKLWTHARQQQPEHWEHLFRHLGGLIASRAAYQAARDMVGDETAATPLAMWTRRATRVLSGECLDDAFNGLYPDVVAPDGLDSTAGLVANIHAAFNALHQEGLATAQARCWTLDWLPKDSKQLHPVLTVPFVAVGHSDEGVLALWQLVTFSGPERALVRYPHGLHRPLTGGLEEGVADAWSWACRELWNGKPPNVAWWIKCPSLGSDREIGGRSGTAAFALGMIALARGTGYNTGWIASADFDPNSGKLIPVTKVPEKLEFLIRQNRLKDRSVNYGVLHSANTIPDAETDQHFRSVKLHYADDIMKAWELVSADGTAMVGYLESVAGKLDEIAGQFPHFRKGSEDFVRLSSIAISPKVQEILPKKKDEERQEDSEERELRLYGLKVSTQPPRPWDEVRKRHQRAIVVAPPGQGKSTLAWLTAREIALESLEAYRTRQEPLDSLSIPVFVSLSELSKLLSTGPGDKDMADILAKLDAPNCENARHYIARNIKLERFTLLLDGLDEVSDPGGLKPLWEFLAGTDTACRIVITSRPHAYDGALGLDEQLGLEQPDGTRRLPAWQLADLTEPEAWDFAGRWFEAKDAPERLKALKGLVERSSGATRQFMTSPYLWTMLCWLIEDQSEPLPDPPMRSDLYEQMLIKILGTSRSGGPVDHTMGEDRLQILREAGFALFEKNPASSRIGHKVLLGALKRETPRDRLKLISELSDKRLLIPVDAGRREFVFPHRSILEYLAGSYLAESVNAEGWEHATCTVTMTNPDTGETARCEVNVGRFLMERAIYHVAWHEAFRFAVEVLRHNRSVTKLLLDRFGDGCEFVRRWAVEALGPLERANKDIQGAVLALLGDEHPLVRRAAIRSLEPLAKSDGDVRRATLACLKDTDWQVRPMAVEALRQVAGSDADIREALLARIGEEDALAREAAVEVLGPLVGNDGHIRDALLASLGDEDWCVRMRAVDALGPLAGSDGAIRELLLVRFGDENEEVHGAVVGALRLLAGSNADIREALLTCLGDKAWLVRMGAVEALDLLVGSDGDIRKAVLARLEDEIEYVRGTAVEVLGLLVGSDGEICESVVARLEDEIEWVRCTAVEVLGPLVGSDVDIRKAVLARLEDENEYVRGTAVEVLGLLVGSDGEIRESVVARLEDEMEWVRFKAVEVLTPLVCSDDEICEALLARLWDRGQYCMVCSAAARGLGSLAEIDGETRNAVAVLLEDVDWSMRRAAVEVLGPLMGNDGHIRDALLASLGDEDWCVRMRAVDALGPLAGSDGAIREAVLLRVEDEDSSVRRAAAKSIGEVCPSTAELGQVIASRYPERFDILKCEPWWRAWLWLLLEPTPPDG